MPRASGTTPALLVAACTALLAPRTAHAYRTLRDLPELAPLDVDAVRWLQLPIEIELSTAVPGPYDAALMEQALRAALETWNATPCTPDVLAVNGTVEAAASAFDGFNTVQWITDGWTELAPADAAAATDVAYQGSAASGFQIVEADIYLNGDTQVWPESQAEALRSMHALLAHELGHVLGLSHPCEPGGGSGVPACNPDDFPITAMHPRYDESQLELAYDDVAGLCFLYPPPGCSEGDDCAIEWPVDCEPGDLGCAPDDGPVDVLPGDPDGGVPTDDAGESADAGDPAAPSDAQTSASSCSIAATRARTWQAAALAPLFALGSLVLRRRRRRVR